MIDKERLLKSITPSVFAAAVTVLVMTKVLKASLAPILLIEVLLFPIFVVGNYVYLTYKASRKKSNGEGRT